MWKYSAPGLPGGAKYPLISMITSASSLTYSVTPPPEPAVARSDVAIVDPYGDSPYVLAVYTSGLDAPAQAYDGIAQISRIIYGRVAGTDL